jgi:hypothetical protein
MSQALKVSPSVVYDIYQTTYYAIQADAREAELRRLITFTPDDHPPADHTLLTAVILLDCEAFQLLSQLGSDILGLLKISTTAQATFTLLR